MIFCLMFDKTLEHIWTARAASRSLGTGKFWSLRCQLLILSQIGWSQCLLVLNLLMWWPLHDDTDWSSVYSNVRSGGGSGRWPKLWWVQDAYTMVNWFSQWQELLARLATMSHSCAPFPPLSTSMWHCTWSVCSKSSKRASLGKILGLNLQKIDT